jgi:hypothetical protein
VADPQFLGEQLATYTYSSLIAHTSGERTPISAILDTEAFSLTHPVRMQKMLQEARRYCADSGLH